MSASASPGRFASRSASARRSVRYYLRGWASYFLEYVPGLVLLTSLAAAARWIGAGGHDSYYLAYAVGLGILVRNSIGVSAYFEPGTRLYELLWKVGIVLLGSQMALGSFRAVGLKGFLLAATEVVGAISLTLLFARWLKVGPPLCYLLAAGMGICGVSAVVALAGVLHTEEEDTTYAVSVILLFGLATLSVLPAVGWLLHLSDLRFGLWAGLTVNNTAEAVATGFVYSEEAGRYATIAKLCRNAFLDFALLYFVQRMVRSKLRFRPASFLKGVWQHFPKFAIGLVAFSVLTTFHFWSSTALIQLNHLYRWALLLGFAGIGLRTDLRHLFRRGIKPLGLALGIQTLMLLSMCGLVLLLF